MKKRKNFTGRIQARSREIDGDLGEASRRTVNLVTNGGMPF